MRWKDEEWDEEIKCEMKGVWKCTKPNLVLSDFWGDQKSKFSEWPETPFDLEFIKSDEIFEIEKFCKWPQATGHRVYVATWCWESASAQTLKIKQRIFLYWARVAGCFTVLCCMQHGWAWVWTPTNACGHMIYKYVDWKSLVAFTPLHRGIVPEVNLKIARGKKTCKQGIHPGFETQSRCHQNFQNRDISGPIKRTYVLQNFLKKEIFRKNVLNTALFVILKETAQFFCKTEFSKCNKVPMNVITINENHAIPSCSITEISSTVLATVVKIKKWNKSYCFASFTSVSPLYSIISR